MQRDTAAILDVDHDGKQDIVHCWAQGTDRYLVYRRGSNGQVIRQVKLPGSAGVACQIAGMRMADRLDPILLVAEKVADGSCPRNFIGYWPRTTAYDLSGRLLWGRNTCDAGHQAYPLDENQDGKAEAVFVGKYLLRSDGTLQCTLQGWPAWDHADAVNVAEIDPTHPGIEAVAVGATGVAGFDAKSCQQLWRVPLSVIDNPQHMTLARLDAASPTPQVFVEEKDGSGTFVLNGKGQVIRKILDTMPMQNANLDNARGTDELIGSFGEALGFGATKRLTKAWFWWLKGTKVVETTAVLSPTLYGKWQAYPLIMDVDGDGRDEIVQWGQSLIVVGKAS
jgi:hypothetical protein